MTKERSAVRRFRAKVASQGFRNQHWNAGDVVEVTPEEAEIIPHHFEELGKADDESDTNEMREKIAEQEKLQHVMDNKARKTYDEVKPTATGGPAVAVAKTAEQLQEEAEDRKAEEQEKDKAREEREAERKGTARRKAKKSEAESKGE